MLSVKLLIFVYKYIYEKKCLASFVIREMQINIIVGYHFISTRMPKIKKADKGKCWKGCGATRTLLHCW